MPPSQPTSTPAPANATGATDIEGAPSWPTRAALAAVLVVAIALRFGFSTTEPNASGFFFDERIPLENIESILDTGSLRPQNFWYQSLSYLPQAAVLGAGEKLAEVTGWETLRIRDDDGFRPLAYRLCRATTILFGALSIGLTFVIGRRLFSQPVGLLAAFLLAVLPWHIFTSARFKPDSLLLLLTLVTFARILDVEEHPSRANFAWAGLGIGLTVATKLNGFVIAVPLVLLAARRRPRQWLGLGLAAATALVVYLVLNPWVGQTLATLDQNREYYALAAEREGSGHADVLVRSLASLVEPQFHGGLLGSVVVAGALLVLATALGRRRHRVATVTPGRARTLAWLLLSFPVAQILINAAATERFKENHLVQIAPFTCLLAAHALVELFRISPRTPPWMSSRLPSRPSRRRRGLEVIFAMAVAGIVAMAGFRGFDAVYRSLVPTTFEGAVRALASRGSDLGSAVVCTEAEPSRSDHQLARNLGFVVTPLGPWGTVSTPRLDVCDVLLFDATHLANPEGLHSEHFAATAAPRRWRFEGSWFEQRGDDLVMLIADWKPVGDRRALATTPKETTDGHTVVIELPGCIEPEQTRSLDLRVPIGNLKEAWPTVAGGPDPGVDLRWHHVGKRRPGHLLGSERLPCHPEPLLLELSIAGTPPPGSELRVWVRGWRRGSGP